MFDLASEHKNGKYRRILQILKEKLPLLYVKFGEDILDYSVEFKAYKKEIENVRWLMCIIENEDWFFEYYPYIIDDILKYVRGGLLDISDSDIEFEMCAVIELLHEIRIDRFDTILDIGTGDGEFPALSILTNTTKYAIGIDNYNPKDFFGIPQQFPEIQSRVDYRLEDGISTKYRLPESSLITCFYVSEGRILFPVVDNAVRNNACLIMQCRDLDIVAKYAGECNMDIIKESDEFSFDRALIAIPDNW